MQNPIHLIQPLPDLTILVIVVLIVTVLAVLAPSVGQRIFRLPPNASRDEAAADAFKVVFGMAAVVLSFSLVQATTNVRTVEQLVGKEGAVFSAVDRGLLRFGTAEAAAARPLLAQYGKGRIEVEWPLLAHGERSSAVDLLYNNLSRTARALQPGDTRQQSMFAELLRNLDDLAEARELVIAAADTELSPIFWIMSCGLLAIGIALATLSHPTIQRRLTLGATAAAVSLLLCFVITTDRPFVGEDAVTPGGIAKILALNSRRV